MQDMLYFKCITNKKAECGSLDGKGGLGENGYMYMYGWVPSLSTWNYHNIVNRLYLNTKVQKKKRYPRIARCYNCCLVSFNIRKYRKTYHKFNDYYDTIQETEMIMCFHRKLNLKTKSYMQILKGKGLRTFIFNIYYVFYTENWIER